ncbi:MAG: YncE family protein [Hyphomicrobiaceae bacterium]
MRNAIQSVSRPMLVGSILLLSTTAQAGDSGNVYVPLGTANAIVIIDAKTSKITGKIDGVPNAHGLAKTPDGRYLIAGRNDERKVGSSAPQKPAGVSADDHAAHHTKPAAGKAKSTGAVSSLSVIRIKDRAVVRLVDVPGAVHHVAVNRQGSLAVVTHPNQDAASLVDLKAFVVVATIATGPLPNYAAFSPDGQHAYVSNAGNNTVSDIDVARKIVLRNIAVGDSPEHLVLTKDGTRLFVNNVNDGTVSAVDLRTGNVARTYRVGSSLHGIDLSADEKTLYVAALGDDMVAAVDLANGKLRTMKLSPAPYHLATIRGTGRVFVSSAQQPKLWVLDGASLKLIGEVPIGGKGHQMVHVDVR